jgi:hypothetical protein
MKIRSLIALLLVTASCASIANADPGVNWSQIDPPNFLMVADLSSSTGLEGLYAEEVSGDIYGVSLADFHDLGRLPNVGLESYMEILSMDLDEDAYAEVVILKRPLISPGFIAAYKHNGANWIEIWRTNRGYDPGHTDLQMVDLDGIRRGQLLLATGQALELLDPATGLVVWSSTDPAQGPGSEWVLGNWTLANYDQDADGTEELLVEFATGTTDHQLLMIGDVGAAAATPLQATIISLGASRPNPMFGATTVQFELPESTLVRLNIYDVRGRRVTTLANRTMSAGSHALRWNGNDKDGSRVAQGVYFYELKAAGQTRTRKMMVVR